MTTVTHVRHDLWHRLARWLRILCARFDLANLEGQYAEVSATELLSDLDHQTWRHWIESAKRDLARAEAS